MKSGAYQELGSASQQQDLDFGACADLIQAELDRLLGYERSRQTVNVLSRIVRGSLKLDYYKYERVHGEMEDLRTRLIFSSCVVRGGIMRSLLMPSFERTIQGYFVQREPNGCLHGSPHTQWCCGAGCD